jgi:hypothetical protein
MRTYKVNLPDGVKKTFGLNRGVKVRLINKRVSKKTNKETQKESK